MARNLDGYARACNSLCLDPFYSYLLIPEEKKNIWSELESKPGPLAFLTQVTALITRPWLLRQDSTILGSLKALLLATNATSEIVTHYNFSLVLTLRTCLDGWIADSLTYLLNLQSI